jgi:hypothetical protein
MPQRDGAWLARRSSLARYAERASKDVLALEINHTAGLQNNLIPARVWRHDASGAVFHYEIAAESLGEIRISCAVAVVVMAVSAAHGGAFF